MAAITLDIGGNTRQLDRDIQKTVNRVYSINLKTKGDQPLGRITGKVNEFTKSLDASNARVIAFGASAGIIFGLERAFTALVSSTIEVQKSLQDINVILNASQANLQKFGAELFNIARNTGQSFQEVAKAATEFSRQGLGIEETLKRTNEALILSRLSGLDAAKSVESLTAAVNSFASQAVTATEVVNKFATVDAAFAVSSADLADAIARVGSSAAQSGVSLDELIAIVTSAQQTTARGGAVIGNSFKTIFTRLQREKVVDLLESLGISGTDASGQVKSTIQLLQELGKVYDTLGSQQQAYVAEQVGGVFQINILKAALADLGKEYSIYSSALNVSAGATDQAIRRNEELNKTYAAQINALAENARQLAAAGGERLLGPSIDRLVGGTNTLLEGFNESDGQGIGAVLGKGILDGIGQFIAGPGLALIGGVLLKLFRDLAKFATGSVQQLLGLNTAATQQRDLQQSINSILAKNPQLLELALKGEQGLNTAANSLLASLQKQTVELQKQAAVAAQISKAFIAQAGVRVAGGVPVVPAGKTPKAKSGGFIPNFSVQSELTGIKKSRDYTSSQKRKAAGDIRTANFPGIGPTVFNGQETIAKSTQVAEALGYPKGTKPKNPAEKYSILTPKMSDDLSIAAKGFIPNFALDTVANLKSKASRSGGLLGNLYNVGDSRDKGIKDEYSRPSIKRVPLQKNVSQYTKVADAFIRDVRKRASSDPSAVGSIFNNLKYKNTPISQFTDKIKPQTLLDPRKDRFNNINIKGALGEIDSQKRFSSGGRTAEKQGDLFGADFLVKKQGGNYLVESKVTQRKVPDNILIAKALQYEGQIKGGKYKDRTLDEIKLKNIILSYAPFKSAASGFIPNFAQGKNAIDLGDTRTSPALKGKVLSLIHPGISQGYSMTPATASYLGQQYRGLIPVAGINEQVLKGQLPDLDKNLGDLLVREANQFGQAIGGGNFLKSAQDLPNFGAAKGAVGVAFEGGLLTLLRQNLQKTAQNAGIDFRQNRITPKLRNLFHGAPGMYDAKYSPELVNDVMSKLLQEAKVGEVKKVKSGPGYKDYDEQRKSALNYIRSLPPSEQPRRGNALEAAIRKRIAEQARLKGMAAGFIPNFAAPLVRAVDDKELRIMLSKFGKGWAFQGRSSEQSALEYFGGSGTYMWDALSRPGEQMSDRQAYKQNIGRAKNWASARKQSSWLVRYNRSKLKDSELLPDMETGGASVYGLPLSKDQIVWPIKQSGGPGRIFEKDIPAFLSGQVNDAIKRESEAGIPKNKIYLAQEKALTSANPMGLGVFNKLQEPTKQSRKDAMRRKGFASGYIPNFAIEDPDVQAADLGSSIGAVVAQLGFLAFSLQGSREQYKQSLEELTKTNVAQAKINSKNLREDISTRRFVGNQVGKRDFSQYTGPEKGKDFGDLRRASRSPLSQERRDAAARELRAARNAEKTAARGTGGQKFAAASGAGGFALSLGAPILAETIKNAIGQETAGARKAGAAVGAAGQIASFAGAGAMFGPWGAAIGAATGALLTVPGLIDEMTATAPEFAKAAKKASEDLTKFNDAGQRVLTSSAELSKLLKEGGSKNSIQKAQEAYNKSLLDLSSVDRQRLASAAKIGKLEEEYSKILAEKIAKERSAQSETALAGVRDDIADFGSRLQQEDWFFAGSITGNAGSPLSLSSEDGRKRRGQIAEAFTTELRGNKSPEEFLKSLRDIKIPKEVTNKAQFDSFINGLKDLPSGFKNTLKEIAAEDPEAAFQLLRAQIIYLRKDTADFIKDSAALQAAEEERQAILKQEQAAIDATVSSIQKNIAIQNLWKSAIENINESIRSFSDDLQITQTLTQPKEVLGNLIGEDKTPTRRLAAQEGIARIDQGTRSALATAGIDFKETLRGITQAPFQENIDKIVKKLGEQGGALTGEPKDIIKQSSQFQSEAKAEEQKLLQATQNMEDYMAQFVNGQISTQQLLEQSKTELAGVGIDVSRGSQASDAIEKAVAELEVKTVQEQVKAFQQRAKLASETKQAILQDKINQAIGTFGGFEGFMNRPNEEENYIQKIQDDFDTARSIRRSGDFRYNVPGFADKARDKQAPDLGRAFSGIYKELIGQSGGAFRGFIQKEVDAGRQLSGTSGGRISKTGGFDDIIRGRKVDIEQQLQLAKDQLKIETDPVLKRTLEGFIQSIENMPGGTQGIATLQTMQEFGVARQSDYQELYKKFDVAAFDKLSEISPDLAATLASATAFTDDPLLNEASAQTAVQTEILKTIRGLSGQDGMIAPFDLEAYANEKDPAKRAAMKAGYDGVTPFDLEAYAKEKDPAKRAAMKAGYSGITPVDMGSTAGEAVKNQIKAIQNKILPTTPKPAVTEPQKTIAEIEAETRAKRDQKYLQSQLAPRSRETGQKFESIAQVEKEMTKLKSAGPMTEKDSKYYRVLENFRAALNPVGDMSTITGRAGYSFRKSMYLQDIDRNTPKPALTTTSTEPSNSVGQIISTAIKDAAKITPPTVTPQAVTPQAVTPQAITPQGVIPPTVGAAEQISAVIDFTPVVSAIAIGNEFLSIIAQQSVQDQKNTDLERMTSTASILGNVTQGDFRGTYDQENFNEKYDNLREELKKLNSQQQQLRETPVNKISAAAVGAGALGAGGEVLVQSINTLVEALRQQSAQNNPAQSQGVAQPNVQTTTNAPVTLVVNAEKSTDVSAAIEKAILKAIPEIVKRVQAADGKKIPPTAPKKITP